MHDNVNAMFTTNPEEVLKKIETIDVVAYAKSRNYLDGAVTRLSPYISHGVISLPYIVQTIRKQYSIKQAEKFIQELAWREFFLRVWEAKKEQIHNDMRFAMEYVSPDIPNAIIEGNTGIHVIDNAITALYENGYMHNHERLWLASIVCNLAKTHWFNPSQWLYYHLFDGDIASNTLSWQWVAGTFSHKKYYANQENINTYSGTQQRNTFLDTTYESLEKAQIPKCLESRMEVKLETNLPKTPIPDILPNDIVQLYHPFTLDYRWKVYNATVAILLLEPTHFAKFPISPKRIDFIRELAQSIIPNIHIVVAEQPELPVARYYAKKHPLTSHWKAEFTEHEYLFPHVRGYFKNFFSYWQDCQKYLQHL